MVTSTCSPLMLSASRDVLPWLPCSSGGVMDAGIAVKVASIVEVIMVINIIIIIVVVVVVVIITSWSRSSSGTTISPLEAPNALLMQRMFVACKTQAIKT